jgi:predicted DNA-binding WGR domain protein
LDVCDQFAKNKQMEISARSPRGKLQMLVLERRDESRNMARFYVLAVEPTLLGDSALVREWGRIGTIGRRRLDLHPDAAAAGEALEKWLARKTQRGYRLTESRGCERYSQGMPCGRIHAPSGTEWSPGH